MGTIVVGGVLVVVLVIAIAPLLKNFKLLFFHPVDRVIVEVIICQLQM